METESPDFIGPVAGVNRQGIITWPPREHLRGFLIHSPGFFPASERAKSSTLVVDVVIVFCFEAF
jgi:hypothetical protein